MCFMTKDLCAALLTAHCVFLCSRPAGVRTVQILIRTIRTVIAIDIFVCFFEEVRDRELRTKIKLRQNLFVCRPGRGSFCPPGLRAARRAPGDAARRESAARPGRLLRLRPEGGGEENERRHQGSPRDPEFMETPLRQLVSVE